MEQIKLILKRQIILIIAVAILGLILRNKYIYIGFLGGTIVSLLGFLVLCYEAKSDLAFDRGGKLVGIRRYIKRIVLYGIFLFLIVKIFDDKMLFAGFFGIMTIRFNILLDVLWKKIYGLLKEEEKK